MVHSLSDQTRTYSMSAAHAPALTVAIGDTVTFQTRDCYDGQVTHEPDPANLEKRDRSRGNPSTGPVYVEGALPGGTLVCTVDEITLAERGLLSATDRHGAHRTLSVVEVSGGYAEYAGRRLRVDPIVGVLGVAPAAGAVPNSTPGPHGGNLDTRDVRIGSRVYLPVAHEGALFGCGDVHALQGDGEVCGQGIEIAAEVSITLDYTPRAICAWPVVATPAHYAIIAAAEDLDAATDLALLAARDMLIEFGGFSDQEAIALMSIVGDMRICQIVNPLRAVRACIPRSLLPLPA